MTSDKSKQTQNAPAASRSGSSARTKIYFIILMALAAGIFVFASVFRNIADSRAYDKYMQTAELSYSNADYDSALSSLRKAAAIDETEECLELMAECYENQGNYEKALETLRLISTTNADTASKISSIEDKRQQEANADLVTIAGEGHRTSETSLVLDGKGLDNSALTEVAKLYSLDNLSLADNNFSDISALSSLGGLTTLNLNNNQISSITPLANLQNLRVLYLDNNPIADLSPLYYLTSLRTLSLKGMNISEKELEALSAALPDCTINGVTTRAETPLVAIGGQTFSTDVTEINLSGCNISDISALSQCSNLTSVDLSNNMISDISPLMDIPGLVTINISNNNITDMRPLMGLNSIKSINASGNNISTTVPIGAITTLTELKIADNPISNFSGLKKLKNLVTLDVSSTGLTDNDVKYFRYLSRITNLNIEDNDGLSSAGYTALSLLLPNCGISHSELTTALSMGGYPLSSSDTVIDLSNCGISDISAVMSMTSLETVKLPNNAIYDIQSFQYTESWRTLTYLDLGGNMITDISSLSHLTQLQTLNLSDNRISDFSPLYGLSNLRLLYIGGNGISEYALYLLETSLPNCTIISQ